MFIFFPKEIYVIKRHLLGFSNLKTNSLHLFSVRELAHKSGSNLRRDMLVDWTPLQVDLMLKNYRKLFQMVPKLANDQAGDWLAATVTTSQPFCQGSSLCTGQ